ncbi:MAG: GxxExxY protein [Desulfobacterales bacterium]
MIQDDVTYRIIGCAMKVYNVLGSGFQEVIYQWALAIEMGNRGLKFLGAGNADLLQKEWKSVNAVLIFWWNSGCLWKSRR